MPLVMPLQTEGTWTTICEIVDRATLTANVTNLKLPLNLNRPTPPHIEFIWIIRNTVVDELIDRGIPDQ